jgi:plastocyanin
MKRNLIIIILVILIGGAAVFGLSRNNNNNSPPNTASSNTSGQNQSANQPSSKTSNSNAPTATSSVSIENFAFMPPDITVKKGTSVTWTNNDSTAHTVTEVDSQNGPKSEQLENGEKYSFTFDTAGTFHYHCSIHPNMLGTVTVTE